MMQRLYQTARSVLSAILVPYGEAGSDTRGAVLYTSRRDRRVHAVYPDGTDEVLGAAGGGSGAPTGATYLTLSTDATLTAERVWTPGNGLDAVDGGAGGAYTVTVDETELDHAALGSNKAWASSGHTGTASRVAAFDGGGAAAYLQVGVDLQAYNSTLASLATLGTPPSPWHVLGLWGGALAWVVGVQAWAKYDITNSDPDTGNGTSTATNWTTAVVSDVATTDGGASALGRGRSLNAGTLSASRAYLWSSAGVAPFRRDAGFRLTHSFSVGNVGTHRFWCVVGDTDFSTLVAADDTSGAAIYGLRWIPADGANLQIIRNAASGASTVTDSGVAYTAGVRYTVSIYTVDTSTVGIEIISHSAWNAGTVTRTTHTTTIPAATTSLRWGVGIRTSAANATAQSLVHYETSMQAG